ncbi:hypothetical protein CK503_15775 [Aliifodinibius salipaludis]|uniref:Uncharacterized protein n=1 Tax=Fodinibius salipaludis TaxID=2032627 RepID=A0A2A2G665_9BACT|nr:hypothetical protein [Aliifodinibius salipaludis]PAU92630.1 hypothetical protein CK503_15775 [Aliifodinibius salipaludis]
MQIDKEVLSDIKRGCNYLIENYDHFADYRDDLEFSDDPDDYNDFDYIPFYFPGEYDYIEVHVANFLRLVDEFPTLEIVNKGRIKTKSLTYQIVSAANGDEEHVIKNFHDFSLPLDNGIHIDVVEKSFIVGLAATKLDAYDEDFLGSISPYLAVEIEYPQDFEKLSEQEEENLIKSYLFEIADSSGISLKYSEINDFDFDHEAWEKEMKEKAVENLRNLEPYNEGMRLFVSALQIEDPELKLLNFYKILEHFAPVVVNIEGNELMRKKLDVAQTKTLDGDFIRSIFDLAKSFEEKFRDEELIKSIFNVSFDFVGLFEHLPNSIRKQVRKQTKFEKLTYETDNDKIATACNMVAKILYATRNRVVHSKSNFSTNGNECPNSDLNQFNEFLKHASSQTIRWYNRLPKHQKSTDIQ